MSEIITELSQIAEMLSGKQKDYYQELVKDAKEVRVVSINEVFNKDEIQIIKEVLRPKMKECYKNSFMLTMMFPDKVKYCEGKVMEFISIDHAFNKVGDKYVDITFELALNKQADETKEYVVFGEYNEEEMLEISKDMEYYGGIHEHNIMKKLWKKN